MGSSLRALRIGAERLQARHEPVRRVGTDHPPVGQANAPVGRAVVGRREIEEGPRGSPDVRACPVRLGRAGGPLDAIAVVVMKSTSESAMHVGLAGWMRGAGTLGTSRANGLRGAISRISISAPGEAPFDAGCKMRPTRPSACTLPPDSRVEKWTTSLWVPERSVPPSRRTRPAPRSPSPDAVARVVRSVRGGNPIGQSVRVTLSFMRSGTSTHDSGSGAASPLRPVVASGFARQASSPLIFCQDVPVSVP